MGAAEAVRRAGKAGEIVIVGWDTAPDEIEAVEDGLVTAFVAQNPFRMGYEGVNAAVRMIREGAEVEGADTGSILVIQENLNDSDVQAVLDPSCDNPPRPPPDTRCRGLVKAPKFLADHGARVGAYRGDLGRCWAEGEQALDRIGAAWKRLTLFASAMAKAALATVSATCSGLAEPPKAKRICKSERNASLRAGETK